MFHSARAKLGSSARRFSSECRVFQTSSSRSNESRCNTNFVERSKRNGTSFCKSNSTWFQLRFPTYAALPSAGITQFPLSVAQIEQRILPGARIPMHFRSGNVTVAIFFVVHGYFGTVRHQLVYFKLPVQKRKHGDTHLHAVCVEQRRFAGTFQAVQRQVIEFRMQAPRVQMKSAQLDARTGPFFQLRDQCIARPALCDSKLENAKHYRHCGADQKGHGCQPMWPAKLHEPLRGDTMSSFSLSRDSPSHFAARSLMACWISTSRMVSSTSSSGGTGSLRAFNCGENSSR